MLSLPSSVLHVVKALPDDQDLQLACTSPTSAFLAWGGLGCTPTEVRRYKPWHSMAHVCKQCMLSRRSRHGPVALPADIVDYRGS